MLEVKLKNQEVAMPNTFMAAFLIKKSRLTEMEKSNVLATVNVENDETVLKYIKKKVKEVDTHKTKEITETLYGENRGKTPERNGFQSREGFRRDRRQSGHDDRRRSYSRYRNERN